MARLLIVEDDESDRLMLGTILEAEGHELETARDGDEALQAYRAGRIDAVVTDIVMAGTDGVELIMALRRVDPSAAVVAISGKGQVGLHFAELAGAMEILTKPIDQVALLGAVDKALGRRERLLDEQA